MSQITTVSVDQLLKQLYAPWEIEGLVNLTYPLLNQCAAKGSAALGGTGFIFPVRVESAEGHAYIGETGQFPSPGQSVVRQATVSPTIQIGVVELTGLSREVSSQNPMAFAKTFDENIQQTLEAMTAYKEGTLFRDGTGIIGRFAGNPAATVGPHVLDDVGFLREGMRVDVRLSGGNWEHSDGAGTPGAELQVAEVDWTARTVTFTTALEADVDDNATIYLADSQVADVPTAGAAVREPLGLEASLLDTGVYLGIARTTGSPNYPNWKSNVIAAGGFFDEDVLLRARDKVTQESGIPLQSMASRFKAVCHPTQVSVLFKLAIPRIRYTGNDAFDLGNGDNVSFGGIKFATSYLCQDNVAYAGDWMYSKSLYTPNGELHIDTEYNGAALKWVSNQDIGVAFAKQYHQFVVTRPNAFVRITGLTQAAR